MISKMNRLVVAGLALFALAGKPQEPTKEELRLALGDTDLAGPWIYDDLSSACAEGKKSGKPLMVVIRCVP